MKNWIRQTWYAYFLYAAAALLVLASAPARATAQDEVIPTGISPLSKRVGLLSFPLSVFPFVTANQGVLVPNRRFQELVEIKVFFEDRTEGRTGLNLSDDFLPLTASALSSGLALFKESGAQPDGFNFVVGNQNSDIPVDLREPPIVEPDPANPGNFMVTFRPVSGSVRLNTILDQFPDFYIVGQTSLNLLHGDRFEVSIPPDGITIRDLTDPLPDNTLFDNRFPGPEFADLNERFAVPAVFEGDIVEIVSTVDEADNTNRIEASSEPTSVIGLDVVGRDDQGYFIEEVRVNWIGINLGQIARLIANRSQSGYNGAGVAGLDAAAQIGIMQQVNFAPTFFYSPWFYNVPVNPETGEVLTIEVETPDGPVEFPMTVPLDNGGFPRPAFFIQNDDLNAHVTGYVPYGPRLPGTDGLTPRVISPEIFEPFRGASAGGVFLFRELGGTKGKFDNGVDQLLTLDESKFRVETFGISPEDVQDPQSPIRSIIRRLVPGVVAERRGIDTISFLFNDDNLAAELMGVAEMPDPANGPRPPYGTLACYDDPDCLFFDLMINVLRPYLGLTEGQIRYLFEYTAENGISNMEELFGFPIVQGFSFVMPVARNNALSNLKVPSTRTGSTAGADIYVGIRTSDQIRSLDAFIPFIRPNDIKVGTNVAGFTQGATEDVQTLNSVSSLGYGRPNTGQSYAMIGRPKPRFLFSDKTQPGQGPLEANNNNILFDNSQGAPPKAVVGIDAIDFGQNTNLVYNSELVPEDNFDIFFGEATVMGELQVDFLPGSRSPAFNPEILGVLPTQLGVDLPFSRVVSDHGVAIYMDDDTPFGDGIDNDGDGLVDEEDYNLIDDDGDGLIDEDIGDGTPAGTNGVFDSFDRFLPLTRDQYGDVGTFPDATYSFPPNDQTKFEEFLTEIEPEDDPFTLTDGGLLPLSPAEGTWFADIDLRVLNFANYQLRQPVFPSAFQRVGVAPEAAAPFSGPLLNQGTFSPKLDPVTGLLDLVLGVKQALPDFPYYPDDLFVEDPTTGDVIWMLELVGDVPIIQDPDGDLRRTFALSLAAALRIPNPLLGFVRVGNRPMVVDTGSDIGENPTGDGVDTDFAGNFNFGFFVQSTEAESIGDYVESIVETLTSAYDGAYDAIDSFNEAVADAEESAAEADPPEEPEYPELPEPAEVTIADPYETLGLADFGGDEYNYQYQIQIPDENFGPLAGDDFFVVLRASDDAQVGESFRVRIRQGVRNRVVQGIDEDTGEISNIPAPEGGAGYHSFIKTDFEAGNESFRNVSKNTVTTSEIVVRSANVPPRLSFVNPGPGLNLASAEFEFDIQFTAEDPDNVAEIRLFVDNDSLNADGQFIPGASLREGFDSIFTINLQEDIEDFDPTVPYFIYAEISDGVNAPVVVYAAGPITTRASVEDGGGTGGGQVVTEDLENPLDYIKLTDDGRFFNLGDAPSFNDITATAKVVDMEVPSTNAGALVLQEDGKIFAVGTVGAFQRRIQPNGEVLFPPDQTAFLRNGVESAELIGGATAGAIQIGAAIDLEADFANGAIYVLDQDGDMLYLGTANTDLRPQPVGLPIYRDMELTPRGDQLYFLAGNGLFNVAGGPGVGSWSDLIEADKYRDIELLTSGMNVTHAVIVDDDGNLVILGADNEVKQRLAALESPDEIAPGTIRQVKSFPNNFSTLLLVEGSGQSHVLTDDEDILAPNDGFVFADLPGIEDDRIVDTETASINLQAVVDVVREILEAMSEEDLPTIMSHVSPDYSDRSGNDAAGLEKSLASMFSFYEMETFSRSGALGDTFTITSLGDSINARVTVDFTGFYPTMDFIVPDVDASATSLELFGTQLFEGARVPFDQTIRVREVSDGRSWQVELWEIRNYGRNTDELITSTDLEFEDIQFLTRQTDNERIGFYSPRREGIDPPMSLFLDANEEDIFQPLNILAIFREIFQFREAAPPAFEFTTYQGQFLSVLELDDVLFQFRQDADGKPLLTGMNLRQVISENNQDFQLGQTGGDAESPLTSLDGNEVEDPFGFNFETRGPVLTAFQGDADLVMTGDELFVTSPKGGIMMLPENTDIFAVNPETLIRQYNRGVVRANPFDPANIGGGGGTTEPGFSATIVPGRSYLVITRDGNRFGLISLPIEFDPAETTPAVLVFDYRYQSTFELPRGF